MSVEHYTYLNYTSIVLGVLALLICMYCDIPKPYDVVLLWMLPVLIVFNYWSLEWLSTQKR